MSDPNAVTLVRGAIHNPSEPRHFMTITEATGRCRATAGGVTIAESENVKVVKEVGGAIYDPVVYFPRADVDPAALVGIDQTTHCPIKGDTEYFDVVAGDDRFEAAAWSYVTPIPEAEALRGFVAFDTSKIKVE